jgi:hypothetical protein
MKLRDPLSSAFRQPSNARFVHVRNSETNVLHANRIPLRLNRTAMMDEIGPCCKQSLLDAIRSIIG